jgi:hypothetical protein
LGHEPPDERQQKTREIQKTMPFKNHGRGAPGPKAAITQEIKKTVAFLDYGVIYAELSLRNAACDIVFFGFTYYNSQRAKSLRYMHYEVKHKI